MRLQDLDANQKAKRRKTPQSIYAERLDTTQGKMEAKITQYQLKCRKWRCVELLANTMAVVTPMKPKNGAVVEHSGASKTDSIAGLD
jgi:hypothetical protein